MSESEGLTWLLCVCAGRTAAGRGLDSGWKPHRPDPVGGLALRVGGAEAPTHATAGGVAGGRARLATRALAGLPPSLHPSLPPAVISWSVHP